jgi:Family of unknown function (DUF6282)
LTDALRGAIDTHVHSAPDTVARAQDDLELVRSAADAGMRAIVLKNHHFPTADRAALAARYVPGITVLGGLVLNASASGGLNPEAVRVSLQVGGRVFWLPTVSAENNLAFVAGPTASPHLRSLTGSQAAVPVVRDGRTVVELDPVLRLIAEADAVLATGHLSPAESEVVVERAQELGVRRIVVTHPELELVAMAVDVQHRLAARGVFFERCYLNVLEARDPAGFLGTIRGVGIESTILATDLGQAVNPPAVTGLRAYHDLLARAGMSEGEWDTMARRNPARLLGLDGQHGSEDVG